MSNGDSKGDAIEDLREHRSTINSINCALEALTFVDRDTREMEHRLHEIIGDELHESRLAIDRIKSAEDDPEAS